MRYNRISSAIAAAALNVGVLYSGSMASAADMPVKAPPPPAPAFVLDVHGFVDISFKNDYITPRGLLVTNTGLTTQVLGGLALDLYKDPNGFINNVGVYAGVWNDIWSKQKHPTASSWNEFDWFVGMSVKFAKDWKFGVEYVEFLSPPGNFRIERNFEFSLAYDDSSWNPWIPINPYVKLFYAASGDSTVVTGKRGDTFDVEIGIVPTLGSQEIRMADRIYRADLGDCRSGRILESRRYRMRRACHHAVRPGERRRVLDRTDRQSCAQVHPVAAG